MKAGLPDPFPDGKVSVKQDWVDWFLGARFNYAFGPRWWITGRGDVKLAGDSDTAYNVSLFLNRKFGKTMALNLGYRYLDTDYEKVGEFAWNIRQQGPVVRYTWSF